MSYTLLRSLDRISRVRGVRGSMFVAADDGLPIVHLTMEDVNAKTVAAFAASLARKVSGAAAATDAGRLRFVQMQTEHGVLLVAPSGDMLVAVVADPAVNVGLARLEMMRALEAAQR